MFCRPFWRHTQKKCIAGISSSELHVVWVQGHQHQLCFFLGHFAHFVCCAWSAEESPAQNTTFLNLHERLSKSAERLSVQNIEREFKGSTSAYSLRWSLKKKQKTQNSESYLVYYHHAKQWDKDTPLLSMLLSLIIESLVRKIRVESEITAI